MMQCSDKLGLSLELGSFAAGVMISTTDLAQHTLEQVIYYLYLAFCFAYPSFFSYLKVELLFSLIFLLLLVPNHS